VQDGQTWGLLPRMRANDRTAKRTAPGREAT